MAHLSGTALTLQYAALRWLPGAQALAEQWVFPGGSERNEAFYRPWVSGLAELGLADWQQRLLHDPQTSGGLLIAVAAEQAPALLGRLHAAGEAAHLIGSVGPGAGEIQLV
jgi:selenide,water dikinase